MMGGFIRALAWPFSFRGRIGRVPYALASVLVFFVPQLIILAVVGAPRPDTYAEIGFWAIPEAAFATLQNSGMFFTFSVPESAVFTILSWLRTWVLVSLAFRRATDARLNAWTVALVVAPLIQIPMILLLFAAPPKAEPDVADPLAHPEPGKALRDRAAFEGMAAGVALTVLAVSTAALGFGVYGYGLFLATPFLIGAVSAYLANRHGDIGWGGTFKVVAAASTVGALALLGFALEGFICLVVTVPLAIAMGSLGGILGYEAAATKRGSAKSALMSVFLLPALFATERAMPSTVAFEQDETVIVSADADATWRAMIHMNAITEQPALPFRLGLAYPVRGEVIGEGVGAIRHGYFSTGMATERVTDWAPGRRLGFDITSDVPALRELSPYEHVHAPHVLGYFRTSHAAFTLTPLPGGRTRMTLSTWHQLDLQPSAYWLPFTRWTIHANKVRVLAQIRRQAEAEALARAG
jgi:uncharacterized membrane protein YhaH (DUF805 family)